MIPPETTPRPGLRAPSGRWARLPLILAALVSLIAVAGCDDFSSIDARNGTSQVLHFTMAWADGTMHPIGPKALAPGEGTVLLTGGQVGDHSLLVHARCTIGDTVALNAAGQEVARRGPGLCVNQTWLVALPSPTTYNR